MDASVPATGTGVGSSRQGVSGPGAVDVAVDMVASTVASSHPNCPPGISVTAGALNPVGDGPAVHSPASSAGEARVGETPSWRQDIGVFSARKVENVPVSKGAKNKKQIAQYYEAQNAMISRLEDADAHVEARLTGAEVKKDAEKDAGPAVRLAINLSFACNVLLFAIKIFAAIYSGSLAVIASAVDSSLDLLSGSILFCASRIAARKNKYKWPIGKTRLEPVAIIIFASVMGVAALQLVIEGVMRIVEATQKEPVPIKVDAVAYGVIGAVIAVKALLWVLCFRLRHESDSVAALASDHRNDVVTNSVTLAVLLLLGKYAGLWWLDAVAAMVLGMLIIYVWTMTGKAHVQLLAGRVAEKEQLATLTYLAMNHDARITVVDTVRAYYVGAKVVAEVDIVLPAAMPLQEAHDIGEGLQKEIEKLPYVERAYVHLDTEYAHNERDEHTVLW